MESQDQLLRSPYTLLRSEGELMRSTRRLLYGLVKGVDGVRAHGESYDFLLRTVILLQGTLMLAPQFARLISQEKAQPKTADVKE